jgi:hypothetical protein
MIRQENNRRNLKWSILLSFKDRRTKAFTSSVGGKNRPPLMSDNREEERAAFFRSSIVAHTISPLQPVHRRVRLDAPAQRECQPDREPNDGASRRTLHVLTPDEPCFECPSCMHEEKQSHNVSDKLGRHG